MSYIDIKIVDKLKKLTESHDVDLKALALVALHLSVDHINYNHDFLMDKLQSLDDQEHIIKTRWAFAMDYLGLLFTMSRDLNNAVTAHKKSLEIVPSDAYTLTNLANAYKGIGDNVKAVESFKQAIKAQPTRAISYFQLAVLYSSLGQKQEAINAFKNGLKYDPANNNAKQMLSRLEFR